MKSYDTAIEEYHSESQKTLYHSLTDIAEKYACLANDKLPDNDNKHKRIIATSNRRKKNLLKYIHSFSSERSNETNNRKSKCTSFSSTLAKKPHFDNLDLMCDEENGNSSLYLPPEDVNEMDSIPIDLIDSKPSSVRKFQGRSVKKKGKKVSQEKKLKKIQNKNYMSNSFSEVPVVLNECFLPLNNIDKKMLNTPSNKRGRPVRKTKLKEERQPMHLAAEKEKHVGIMTRSQLNKLNSTKKMANKANFCSANLNKPKIRNAMKMKEDTTVTKRERYKNANLCKNISNCDNNFVKSSRKYELLKGPKPLKNKRKVNKPKNILQNKDEVKDCTDNHSFSYIRTICKAPQVPTERKLVLTEDCSINIVSNLETANLKIIYFKNLMRQNDNCINGGTLSKNASSKVFANEVEINQNEPKEINKNTSLLSTETNKMSESVPIQPHSFQFNKISDKNLKRKVVKPSNTEVTTDKELSQNLLSQSSVLINEIEDHKKNVSKPSRITPKHASNKSGSFSMPLRSSNLKKINTKRRNLDKDYDTYLNTVVESTNTEVITGKEHSQNLLSQSTVLINEIEDHKKNAAKPSKITSKLASNKSGSFSMPLRSSNLKKINTKRRNLDKDYDTYLNTVVESTNTKVITGKEHSQNLLSQSTVLINKIEDHKKNAAKPSKITSKLASNKSGSFSMPLRSSNLKKINTKRRNLDKDYDTYLNTVVKSTNTEVITGKEHSQNLFSQSTVLINEIEDHKKNAAKPSKITSKLANQASSKSEFLSIPLHSSQLNKINTNRKNLGKNSDAILNNKVVESPSIEVITGKEVSKNLISQITILSNEIKDNKNQTDQSGKTLRSFLSTKSSNKKRIFDKNCLKNLKTKVSEPTNIEVINDKEVSQNENRSNITPIQPSFSELNTIQNSKHELNKEKELCSHNLSNQSQISHYVTQKHKIFNSPSESSLYQINDESQPFQTKSYLPETFENMEKVEIIKKKPGNSVKTLRAFLSVETANKSEPNPIQPLFPEINKSNRLRTFDVNLKGKVLKHTNIRVINNKKNSQNLLPQSIILPSEIMDNRKKMSLHLLMKKNEKSDNDLSKIKKLGSHNLTDKDQNNHCVSKKKTIFSTSSKHSLHSLCQITDESPFLMKVNLLNASKKLKKIDNNNSLINELDLSQSHSLKAKTTESDTNLAISKENGDISLNKNTSLYNKTSRRDKFSHSHQRTRHRDLSENTNYFESAYHSLTNDESSQDALAVLCQTSFLKLKKLKSKIFNESVMERLNDETVTSGISQSYASCAKSLKESVKRKYEEETIDRVLEFSALNTIALRDSATLKSSFLSQKNAINQSIAPCSKMQKILKLSKGLEKREQFGKKL